MGIIAANSEYVIAAKALVAPARMIDTTIADPAPTCPASPLIAVPIAAKMPAPMMAPMPSAVSCSGPSERCRPPPASPSAMHWSTVLRRNSCVALDKQRRQHQRDRAQQLDEHVERRAGGVLERIADRVTHDGRLVGGAALPAVLTRLDVFLGIVPRPAAVRSEEHTSELQSRLHLVCRLLLEKKKNNKLHIASQTARRRRLQAALAYPSSRPLKPERNPEGQRRRRRGHATDWMRERPKLDRQT